MEKLIDTAEHPVRYTYDERDLRLSISDQLNHTTRFGYDEAGNRTQTVERYTQGEVRTIKREHEYDALYRLTSAVEVYEGPPGEVISSAYTYDAAGNPAGDDHQPPGEGRAARAAHRAGHKTAGRTAESRLRYLS